jgi:hypothetical protein
VNALILLVGSGVKCRLGIAALLLGREVGWVRRIGGWFKNLELLNLGSYGSCWGAR